MASEEICQHVRGLGADGSRTDGASPCLAPFGLEEVRTLTPGRPGSDAPGPNTHCLAATRCWTEPLWGQTFGLEVVLALTLIADLLGPHLSPSLVSGPLRVKDHHVSHSLSIPELLD